MREWLARVRDWFHRNDLERDLAEELRFHRDRLERDARADGVRSELAPDVARRRFGNETRVKEEARDRWSLPWLDYIEQDLRYAFRGLRRSPGFAITVIATLGLGIGANAAMFGVIDRLMFRPYPSLHAPSQVDRVYLKTAGWHSDNAYTVFTYTRYLDLAKWSTDFSQYAAFVAETKGVGTGESATERGVLGVSAGFFDFFDAHPIMGRFFDASEDRIPAGANVAVLGYDYWTAALSGRRDVVGESIQVGNAAYTIVGVAPRHFIGVSEEFAPAVFVPITAYAVNEGGGNGADYFLKYNWDWVQMIVRRKPGVTRSQASADLSNAFLRSWDASRLVHPQYRRADQARPVALAGPLKTAAGPNPGLEARTLLWVAGVAAIVLLIACANVANLLLARAMRRRRELALRRALGVSRGRLAAQAFTETLVLSMLGCVAGIVVAQWGGGVIRRLFITDTPGLDVATDWRTLGVATAAALVSAFATGAAPVFFGGRDDLAATLKSGARDGTYQRSTARAALLVVQGALSVALLVGAGLFVRSLSNVRGMRLGYDIDPVLLVEWERRGSIDSSVVASLRQRMLATALARPDVEHGAWVISPVFSEGTSTLNLSVPGIDSVSRRGRFTYAAGSPDYFATIGTHIIRGRSFTDADRAGTPLVVVVSEAMAETLWPGRDAVGQCIRVSWRSPRPDTMPCTTVVGVAENAVHDPAADYPLRYYLPEAQLGFAGRQMVLKMRRDPAAAAEEVRRSLQAVMPGHALVTARPARALVDAKRRSWLVGATMFAGFGVLALLVAAVGLYGVIAYTVAQRMHELGVRIALGAQARDVVRLVVGQGMSFAMTGVVVGLGVALLAARWIQPLLFNQSARDPLTFAGVSALIVLVAIVASAGPALRATRADPNTALRSD